MCKDKLDTICNYMDSHAEQPIAWVMWQLMAKGYTMYQIRKAYYVWLEEI